MKKYKLIGVTKYAEKHLDEVDLNALKEMIGCEIEESEDTDINMFKMPDGEETHIKFLDLEEIKIVNDTLS